MDTFPLLTFSRIAISDKVFTPVAGSSDLSTHMQSTLDWLLRAHDQGNDDGVSYGFSLRGGWLPSYRETTGYILTTFYRAGRVMKRPELTERATHTWHVGLQKYKTRTAAFPIPKTDTKASFSILDKTCLGW